MATGTVLIIRFFVKIHLYNDLIEYIQKILTIVSTKCMKTLQILCKMFEIYTTFIQYDNRATNFLSGDKFKFRKEALGSCRDGVWK